MRIQAWDAVFVRARRADVHRMLRDVAGYGRWWPSADARPAGDRVLLTLRVPGRIRLPGAASAQRIVVAAMGERPDKGLRLRYAGDLSGEAEWYYLDEPAGTVLHYLVNADVHDRGWRRRLAAHRAAVRAALHELKDRLERGREPGAEPDPALVSHQRRAMAAFQADVEAHERAHRGLRGGGGAASA